MFWPRNRCSITKSAGFDVYGQPIPGAKPITEPCSIVSLKVVDTKTALRSDSSASRGNAEEVDETGVILLGPKTVAEMHDRIAVAGFELEVKNLTPQYNLLGRLDHYQVTGTVWRQS